MSARQTPIPIALLCLACAGGCATDHARDVDAYRVIADPPGPVPSFTPGDALPLKSALRLTAAYNEQLAVQGERWVQSLADRQRLAAALRPSIDFFARNTLRENTGNAGVSQTDVGISGQYRLLTGLSDLRNIQAADALVESNRWLILDLRESLLVQTARVYYDAVKAERLASVLENSQRAQSERLADARARKEAGFTRSLDVAQIDAQVSRTRTQLIAAQRQAGEARSLLGFLTSAQLGTSALTDQYTPPADAGELEKLLALAADHRQDVLAARAQAEAAKQLVDASIGQYAPSITVNLDYFLLRPSSVDLPVITSIIELRVPLLSAGRIEADVRSAWSVFRERVLGYRATRRAVQRDVETAHLRHIAAVRLASELQTQVRVAREAFELAEATYQAGLGTNLERVIAQDQLLAAELEAVSAEFDAKTASIELLRAAGLLSSELIGTTLPEPRRLPEPTSPVLDDRRSSLPVAGDAAAAAPPVCDGVAP